MRSIIAISAFLASTVASWAAPVTFSHVYEGHPDYSLVSVFHPGESTYTASRDLTGDGVDELLVRVGDECGNIVPCRTVIYSQDSSGWKVVFDEEISQIEHPDGIIVGGSFVADSLTWRYGISSFSVDVAESGTPVSFTKVPDGYVSPLFNQFGVNAILVEKNRDVKVEAAPIRLTAGGTDDLLVRLSGNSVCGLVYGCPIRVLRIQDNAYVNLLEGFMSSSVAVSASNRDGVFDIVTDLPGGGHAVYGWTGDGYSQAELKLGVR